MMHFSFFKTQEHAEFKISIHKQKAHQKQKEFIQIQWRQFLFLSKKIKQQKAGYQKALNSSYDIRNVTLVHKKQILLCLNQASHFNTSHPHPKGFQLSYICGRKFQESQYFQCMQIIQQILASMDIRDSRPAL